MLLKVIGHECPKCGCNATTLIGAGERYGRPWARYQCDHCSHRFTVGANPARDKTINGVIYRPVRCPACKSKDVPVVRTHRRIRYHKCRSCGQNFKSVEAE